MSSISKQLPVFIISVGLFTFLTGYFALLIRQQPKVQVLAAKTFEPLISQNIDPPVVTAKHVLIKDLTTGEILLAKNADDLTAPASTTKMMTALVAVTEYGWDKPITIKKAFTEGSVAGFKPGETYTVEQLVYSMLIESANDAAEILASAHPGGRAGFVFNMNATAKQLGLSSTTFKNPSGLDEDGHLSSASDLARLGEYLVKQPGFSRIVRTENAAIINFSSQSGKLIANTNPLLGKVQGVLGIKTGFTDNAGQALISLVDRENHQIILVVLNSTDREKDSKSLIDWVYKNFIWQ